MKGRRPGLHRSDDEEVGELAVEHHRSDLQRGVRRQRSPWSVSSHAILAMPGMRRGWYVKNLRLYIGHLPDSLLESRPEGWRSILQGGCNPPCGRTSGRWAARQRRFSRRRDLPCLHPIFGVIGPVFPPPYRARVPMSKLAAGSILLSAHHERNIFEIQSVLLVRSGVVGPRHVQQPEDPPRRRADKRPGHGTWDRPAAGLRRRRAGERRDPAEHVTRSHRCRDREELRGSSWRIRNRKARSGLKMRDTGSRRLPDSLSLSRGPTLE